MMASKYSVLVSPELMVASVPVTVPLEKLPPVVPDEPEPVAAVVLPPFTNAPVLQTPPLLTVPLINELPATNVTPVGNVSVTMVEVAAGLAALLSIDMQ